MDSHTAIGYTISRGAEHLLVTGLLFLLVSFVLMLALTSADNGGTGTAVLSWCENTAFWLGIVFVAGDVAARALRRPDAEKAEQA